MNASTNSTGKIFVAVEGMREVIDMKIDLTVELTKERLNHLMARSSKKGLMSVGHFGTHFDAMGKTFPLDFTESRGIVFDVSSID